MATSRGSSLHTLLNSLEIANKKDCYDFSGGHLNENKLLKIVEKTEKGGTWQSSQKPQIKLTPRSHLMTSKSVKYGAKDDGMEALLKFSIGTDGTIPIPREGKRSSKLRSEIRKNRERQSSYLDDGILIEEFVSRDPVESHELKFSPRELKPSPREVSPRLDKSGEYTSLMTTAITKRDHYKKRQMLENDVVRKQDAREVNVMSGFKAVEHLESRLKHGLDNLENPGHGPNFHRLQVYSNVFSDLISESTAFGPMLKSIKKEYDGYTEYLLDNNPGQHQVLQEQIEQIVQRRILPADEVEREKSRLEELEKEAEKMLAENKRLREEIEKEKSGEYESLPSSHRSSRSGKTRKEKLFRGPDLADKVQNYRTQILENLDEVNEIRKDLRDNFVPVSVCTQLENCVKENEIENQKLARKNESYELGMADLVQSLENEIESADTSESDKKRIWKRIMPHRDAGSKSTGTGSRLSQTSTRAVRTPSTRTGTVSRSGTGSDTEDEDDTKWNWYIS